MPRKKTEPKIEKTAFIQKVEEILGRDLYGSVNLKVTWTIGGMAGGSCYDDSSEDRHYAVDTEEEPELEDLDKVLEIVCPQITFLQYKKLIKSVVSRDKEDRDYCYYGNYYDRMSKSVDLSVLEQYLKEEGIWAE
jgi:hypothetical protein